MKRTPLVRRTPLTAKSELKRTAALGRSPLARSALHAQVAERVTQPKRRTARPIPAKVRRELAARSGGVCEIGAPGCTGQATEAAHRVKRGMGGRKGAALIGHDVLSNLLPSTTTVTTGCATRTRRRRTRPAGCSANTKTPRTSPSCAAAGGACSATTAP